MPTSLAASDRRILVLYVGGTIGMRQTARGLAPFADFPTVLGERLAPLLARLPVVEIEAFATPIDSAEAHPGDWTAIAAHLVARWREFDGFVVLHGTDTMAFTASALSFMLRELDRPVILTGAQIPMDAAGSDGLGNVVAALRYAAEPAVREVSIAFDGSLLRGNRTTKVSTTRLAAFGSPNFPPLGRIGSDGDDVFGGTLQLDPTLLLRPSGPPIFEIPAQGGGEVISLRLVPGIAAERLEACLTPPPRAVVLECYGAGTVPTLGGGMRDFLARAQQQGIVVVALTQVAHGGLSLGTYAAGALLVETGVVDGADMTFEATFTKLAHLIGIGCGAEEMRRRLASALAGEMTL
ncbi:MAG: asparaginase [Ancalomicrobiaceae bacterium]|nr:asparaginase [Ancalomicrobiaceae bacterium]